MRRKKKGQEMNSELETGVELSGVKMGLFMRFQVLFFVDLNVKPSVAGCDREHQS